MQVNLFKNFVEEECCNCGVIFFITVDLNASLRKTRNTFYCPNGHGQSFSKSTVDILKDQVNLKDRTISEKNGRITELENQVSLLQRKIKNKNKK